MSTQLLVKLQDAVECEYVNCKTWVQVHEADDDDRTPRSVETMLRMEFSRRVANDSGLDDAVFGLTFVNGVGTLQVDCTLRSIHPGARVEDNFPLRLMYALGSSGIPYRVIP